MSFVYGASPQPQTGTGNWVRATSPTITTPTLSGNTGVVSGSFGLSGNITAPAWTTAGVRYANVVATLTDTTSTGTVATAYTDVFGGNTIAASSATTFTNYATARFSDPVAGTNVTITNPFSISAGKVSFTNLTATTGAFGGATIGSNALAWTGTADGAGGTATASAPVLNLSQTWNNGAVIFTGIKSNITDTASSSVSLLQDWQVGSVSKASVRKDGYFIGVGFTNSTQVAALSSLGVQLGTATSIGFSSTANWYDTVDLTLRRAAAAALQIGAADAAAPVAQTLQVQSVVAGTSNTAGVDWSFYGSKGTGTGAGGSLKFYTSPAGSTGTAQNAGVLALTIGPTGAATFASNVTAQVGLTTAAASYVNWSGRALFRSPSDGVVRLSNAAEAQSVDFTVGASNLLTLNGGLTAANSITSGGNLGLSAAGRVQFSGITLMTAPADGVILFQKAAGGQLTVSALPSAATAGAGARSFVTDALAPAFGATVVGGGAVNVPVYSDGTNWKVG